MLQILILLVVTILCVLFMLNKKSKVQDGQISQDSLSKNEKIVVWLICLFDPLIGGTILYYGWKNKLPVKAKLANQISLWAFLIALAVLFATNGFSWIY